MISLESFYTPIVSDTLSSLTISLERTFIKEDREIHFTLKAIIFWTNKNHFTIKIKDPRLKDTIGSGWYTYNDLDGCLRKDRAGIIDIKTFIKNSNLPLILCYDMII